MIATWARSLTAGVLVLGLVASAEAQQPSAAPTAAKPAPALPAKSSIASSPAATTSTRAKPASPCKDLEQKACAAKAECSWVAATKRKDGRQVKAYCRLQPKPSAKAPAPGTAAAAVAPAKK